MIYLLLFIINLKFISKLAILNNTIFFKKKIIIDDDDADGGLTEEQAKEIEEKEEARKKRKIEQDQAIAEQAKASALAQERSVSCFNIYCLFRYVSEKFKFN